jgi:hypothetical protein
MDLIAKFIPAPGIPGGRALVLCDGEGTVLPGQAAATLEQTSSACSTLTVQFKIDGRRVRIES